MKSIFRREFDGIFRLKIPFEELYTSVFLIKTQKSTILVDTASSNDDVDLYILPALKQMGYELSDIDVLILTHSHGDHAGGITRIAELAPSIELVTDVRRLASDIQTYRLSGHTEDCIGVLDERTGTLISGDGLQGAGIGKYRCLLENKNAYVETIEKIKNDRRIENILFSHAYEPWNIDRVVGRSEVHDCLLKCTEYSVGEKK